MTVRQVDLLHERPVMDRPSLSSTHRLQLGLDLRTRQLRARLEPRPLQHLPGSLAFDRTHASPLRPGHRPGHRRTRLARGLTAEPPERRHPELLEVREESAELRGEILHERRFTEP